LQVQSIAEEAGSSSGVSVISPLQITVLENLDFGIIAPGAEPATVTLGPIGIDGSRNCSAALTCLGDSYAPGRFWINGQAGYNYSLQVSDSVILSDGGSNSMTASLFHHDNNSQTLGDYGTASFHIGGVLTVGASQAVGNYTGTYAVQVTYQ